MSRRKGKAAGRRLAPGNVRAEDGPRPRKGQRTRAKIKKSVVDLLANRPLAEIHLEDICAASGLTVGGFYFHFTNKDAVLREIAVDSVRRLHEAISALPDNQDLFAAIEGFAWIFLRFHIRWRHLARATYSILRTDTGASAEWHQARQQLTERLAKGFSDARGAEGLDPASGNMLAHFVFNGVAGTCEELVNRPDLASPWSLEEARKAAHELARACYAAVLESPAETRSAAASQPPRPAARRPRAERAAG